MAYILGENQYGKAENRVVRIVRDTARHEIRDLNVSTALRGDFAAAHTDGDQSAVLPTDTQRQTAFAYAKTVGVDSIEEYGLALARHFVDDVATVREARIEIDEYEWERVLVDGEPHDHTWIRAGRGTRTAAITVSGKGDDQRAWVVGGIKDLVILKSTGSEFHGFLKDEFTVLEPTNDRIAATNLVAQWRFTSLDVDWNATYGTVRRLLTETFATVHSLAIQQSLYAMASAVLDAVPEIAEIRMSAPNLHHFLYDIGRFGIENDNEVFIASDRPYGLIQATVQREDAPDAGPAWEKYQAWNA